ncbi:MAG: hypothetical protein ACRCY0_13240 [Synechococcus elongatus]
MPAARPEQQGGQPRICNPRCSSGEAMEFSQWLFRDQRPSTDCQLVRSRLLVALTAQ